MVSNSYPSMTARYRIPKNPLQWIKALVLNPFKPLKLANTLSEPYPSHEGLLCILALSPKT